MEVTRCCKLLFMLLINIKNVTSFMSYRSSNVATLSRKLNIKAGDENIRAFYINLADQFAMKGFRLSAMS